MRWSFMALTAVVVVACKPAGTSRQPQARLDDDIADIEAALSRNADALENAGVAVARLEPPRAVEVGAAAEPEPEPEVPTTSDDAEGEEQDAGGDAPEPTQTEPSEPITADEAVDEPAYGAPEPEPSPEPPADGAKRGRYRASRESAIDRWLRRRRERKEAEARCDRICDLAEATCSLSDQICALTERHPDEERYESACATAESQCSLAASACRSCSGN